MRHWAATLFCLVNTALPLAAQSPVVIHGQVADSAQHPIADVEVTITVTGGTENRKPHTNADGRFTAVFPDGDQSYFLIARKVGYQPLGWSVGTRGQINVITTKAVLVRSIVELPMILTIAKTPTSVADRMRVVIGGDATTVNVSRLLLKDPSDLNELIASLPGTFASDSGNSSLGSDPGQRSVIIDGLKADGSSLPPDAMTTVRTGNTTADVSRGQNASQQVEVGTSRGTDVFASRVRAAATDPLLAWADPASPAEPYRFLTASGVISGPLQRGSSHFYFAWFASQHSSDAVSLLAPSQALLSQFGLVGDTIAAVSSTLTALGAPLTAPSIPAALRTTKANAYLKFDFQPSARSSLIVTLWPSWERTANSGGGGLAYPSLGTTRQNDSHRLTAALTSFVGGFVDDLRSDLSLSQTGTTPDLAIPTGSVRIGTVFSDGRTGLTSLEFGGNASTLDRRLIRWETKNELSRVTANGDHQFRFGQSIELVSTRSFQAADLSGSYGYSSLATLADNEPDTYTRTLDAVTKTSRTALAGLWFGDVWRKSYKLSFDGGFRLDYARIGPAPALNPAVETAFGVRTDRLPIDLGISPRLGFSWVVKDHGNISAYPARAEGTNKIARMISISPTPSIATNTGNRGYTLFGSIGAYRGIVTPDRIAALADATGLPGTRRTLSCVGDAVPLPDWGSATDSTPSVCRDGTGPATFAATQPNVRVFDPSFRAPLSWRASMGFSGLRLGNWFIRPAAEAAWNTNRESLIDLNLRSTPEFLLAGEQNRPVYVSPGEIDPASGAIAPAASRVDPNLGSVLKSVSDLQSIAGKLSVSANTETLFGNFPVGVDYAFNPQRVERRGTPFDPLATEWVGGQAPLHQLALSSNGYRAWWFTMGARLVIASGQAYTPIVAGDINGDGQSGDVAFIANPAMTGDSALAAQVRSLLASAPAGARNCLNQQLGQIAARNSCHTSWQTRFDIKLDFAPPPSFGLGQRLHFNTLLINAGGAIVRLLGLQNTPLGLSPGITPPDTRLLYVTGFDAVAQRYRYQVNSLFGQPIGFGMSHAFPPFQLQVGADYQFGVVQPKTNPLGFKWGKGVTYSEADVRRAMRDRYARDPAAKILAMRDSLTLTADQQTRLRVISDDFQTKSDSMLDRVVRFALQKGRDLTTGDFFDQMNQVLLTLSPLTLVYRTRAEALLTVEQKWKLTAPTRKP